MPKEDSPPAPTSATPYTSKLTRAELVAIKAIESMMKNGCDGMFAQDGTELPEQLADDMEAAGWLSSQHMEAHPDYPGDTPDGGAAYWPTEPARFARGMCVLAEVHAQRVIFADDGEAGPS